MIRLSQIKLLLNDDESVLEAKILLELDIKKSDLIDYKIFKRSIDARKKNNVLFIYTLDVEVKNEEKILKEFKNLKKSPDLDYDFPQNGEKPMENQPVIIGSGPCGLFAAWLMAEAGFNPIVVERGQEVSNRTITVQDFWETGTLNTESNVQFGEGGAGTFSDGKLTTRTKDPRCRKVLEVLVENGAPENILYEAKPHVGTDILKNVVVNMRNKIIEKGGKFLFNSKVVDFCIENEKIESIELNNGEKIKTDNLIVAIGHSARDTFELLHDRGIQMTPKPFAVGVRIEHPQVLINKSQYGVSFDDPKLGAADYHLTYQSKLGRAVYTFCMCPGGSVIGASSEAEHLVVNGMSYHARDGVNATSALLVTVNPEDFPTNHPLSGIEFQRKIESDAFKLGGSNYRAPVQMVGDFIKGVKSKTLGKVAATYTPKVTPANLDKCLPGFVSKAIKEALPKFGNQIKGFDMDEAVITGVETRSSSPVRIVREKETFESVNIKGIYPAGEGAGYAGGIISSAVDGIKVAEELIKKYHPKR